MKKNRDDWLKERTTGLGSTDAAAIVGLSPWKTALHVQAEKLQRIPSHQESELLTLGLRMEPVILGLYEDKTGNRPRRVNKIVRSKKHPFMIASLDAKVTDSGVPSIPDMVIEAKMCLFSQGLFGDEGTDQIPEHYLIQVQHQLAVTGYEVAEVPVLMFGKLRIYRVQRNEKVIDTLVEREKEFWEKHIINQEPVIPDFEHPETLALIKKLWGVDESKDEVSLPTEAEGIIQEYQQWSEVARSADKAKKTAQAELLNMMQGAPAGRTPAGIVLTQKILQMNGYTVQPFTKQIFKIHLPKGVPNATTE